MVSSIGPLKIPSAAKAFEYRFEQACWSLHSLKLTSLSSASQITTIDVESKVAGIVNELEELFAVAIYFGCYCLNQIGCPSC